MKLLLPAALLVLYGVTVADAAPPKRARPPEWTDDQRRLFPEDARELLVGPRPDFSSKRAELADAALPADAGRREASYKWSDLISAAAIETEIKRQSARLQQSVRSATTFKGGGYREARDAFSMLAVMFGVAADYDGRARWQDSAGGFAALFARAGANCKVGTDGSFREAAARGEDLAELIRGGRPDAPKPPADQRWGDLADRSPLMRRMEVALQERLSPMIGSERALSRGAEDAAHEAQVLAALAEVITREGFADADDEDYTAISHRLRAAAADLARAAEEENYEPARTGLGAVGQSCVACHEDYRG